MWLTVNRPSILMSLYARYTLNNGGWRIMKDCACCRWRGRWVFQCSNSNSLSSKIVRNRRTNDTRALRLTRIIREISLQSSSVAARIVKSILCSTIITHTEQQNLSVCQRGILWNGRDVFIMLLWLSRGTWRRNYLNSAICMYNNTVLSSSRLSIYTFIVVNKPLNSGLKCVYYQALIICTSLLEGLSQRNISSVQYIQSWLMTADLKSPWNQNWGFWLLVWIC